MYPQSTAIKLVRSEDFSSHKTPWNFLRHYKLYNGYFTRHYIMTESIQDTSPEFIPSQTQNPEIKNLYPMKLAERIYPWGQCFNSLISNLKSKID